MPEDGLRRGDRRGRVRLRGARGHHETDDAQEVVHHALLPPDPGARGHPGDQHPPVVRPQAQERGPPLLLEVPAPLRLRRHVHHVQGVLRRGEVHARARLRAVLPAGGGQHQLDRKVQPGDRGRHDGGARATLPPGDRPQVPRRRRRQAPEARGGQDAQVGVRGDSGTEQIPTEPGDSDFQLYPRG